MAFILGLPPIPQLGVQPTWRYSTTMDSQRTVDEMLAANFRIFADLKGSALLSTDPKIHKISKMRKYIFCQKLIDFETIDVSTYFPNFHISYISYFAYFGRFDSIFVLFI
jgi:hypothetical protein